MYYVYETGLQFVYKPKTLPCEATLNLPLAINDDRFNNCVPLIFKCRNERCNTEIVIKDIVTEFVNIFLYIVFNLQDCKRSEILNVCFCFFFTAFW